MKQCRPVRSTWKYFTCLFVSYFWDSSAKNLCELAKFWADLLNALSDSATADTVIFCKLLKLELICHSLVLCILANRIELSSFLGLVLARLLPGTQRLWGTSAKSKLCFRLLMYSSLGTTTNESAVDPSYLSLLALDFLALTSVNCSNLSTLCKVTA